MSITLPNSVFIHIPKTGGSYVKACISELGLSRGSILSTCRLQSFEHNMRTAHCLPPKEYGNKNWFTFVRHPVTWYLSYYFFKRERKAFVLDLMVKNAIAGINDGINQFDLICGIKGINNFGDWVNAVYENYRYGYYSRMVEFYTKGCDEVGRQETLTEDLIRILKKYEGNINENKLRKVKSRNMTQTKIPLSEVTGRQKRMIMEMERPMASKYGYS